MHQNRTSPSSSAVNNTLCRYASLARLTPHALKNLKFTCGGGAQVQRVVAEDWLARTGVPILEAYGLTECSPAVCGNIPGAPWDGSVGVPVSSTEVSIRGDGFRDLGVCPEGQIRPNTRVKFACAARKLCAATGKSLKKPPL